MLARSLKPPYFAAIFVSQLHTKTDGYAEMADRMLKLAEQQPGFLGVDSVRNNAGAGITISYWRSTADIERWKNDADHRIAQKMGREKWYQSYTLRVCKVERERHHNIKQEQGVNK